MLSEEGGDGGGARFSVARRNVRAAAAPKLGTGAARCRHPIFMGQFSLGDTQGGDVSGVVSAARRSPGQTRARKTVLTSRPGLSTEPERMGAAA